VPSGGGQAVLSALRSRVCVSDRVCVVCFLKGGGGEGWWWCWWVLVGAWEKRKFFFNYWVCVGEVGIVGGMRRVVGAVKKGCLLSRSSL